MKHGRVSPLIGGQFFVSVTALTPLVGQQEGERKPTKNTLTLVPLANNC